jgi:hypothetical protein
MLNFIGLPHYYDDISFFVPLLNIGGLTICSSASPVDDRFILPASQALLRNQSSVVSACPFMANANSQPPAEVLMV